MRKLESNVGYKSLYRKKKEGKLKDGTNYKINWNSNRFFDWRKLRGRWFESQSRQTITSTRNLSKLDKNLPKQRKLWQISKKKIFFSGYCCRHLTSGPTGEEIKLKSYTINYSDCDRTKWRPAAKSLTVDDRCKNRDGNVVNRSLSWKCNRSLRELVTLQVTLTGRLATWNLS